MRASDQLRFPAGRSQREHRVLSALVVLLMSLCAFAALSMPVFPVRHSEDQRYLVDQNGVPFPIMGRTAWFVLSLSEVGFRAFVDDTTARGFNAIELHVLNHDPRGNNPPFAGNGSAPFLNRLDRATWNGTLTYNNIAAESPDFTTPNDAYWRFVDGFLSYCESKGVLVFLFPAYVGYQGGDQGWMREMVANGATRMATYGAWIATRYASRRNVVWMMGGDHGSFDASQNAVEAALLTGLRSVPAQQSAQFSAEWASESIATDQATFGGAMTLNGIYSWSGAVATHGRRAYERTPIMPAFLLEEPYDEEGPDGNGANPSATQPVRRFQWWGWLSTIGGYISGNGYVWPFRSPDWQNHLDTPGSRDMARMNGFIASIPWYKLVPAGLAGMRAIVVAGGSSVGAADYVAAAASPDGTLVVAYLPPDHIGPVTLDMTLMAGAARARWFDPTTGAYTGAGDNLPNTGTRVFTPPSTTSVRPRDWVLVIDHVAAGSIRSVIEYYNASLDHYFITHKLDEISTLDAGIDIRGWVRTGESFQAYVVPEPAASSICRYYIPPDLGDSHFFGRGPDECASTGNANPRFLLEEAAFMYMFLPSDGHCSPGTQPIFRVFSNRRDANHRYMSSESIRDRMETLGWVPEGDGPDVIAMCAPV